MKRWVIKSSENLFKVNTQENIHKNVIQGIQVQYGVVIEKGK